MRFRNMTALVRASRASNSHFFSKETMEYSKTRFETSLLAGRVFVTSDIDFWNEGRIYRIRIAHEAYKDPSRVDIWTYDPEGHTLEDAKRIAALIAENIDSVPTRIDYEAGEEIFHAYVNA